MSSFRTSPVGSTGTVADCSPYWNACTEENSRRLWLPTSTDSHKLPESSWSGSFASLARNSWFSTILTEEKKNTTTSPMTSSPSSPTLSPSITDDVLRRTDASATKLLKPKKTKKKKDPPPEKKTRTKKTKAPEEIAGKARKIRVYPTKDQKNKLLGWIGAARWTYNRCVQATRNEGIARNKKSLRAVALNSDAPGLPEWIKEVPYDVRDEGMNDLLKAYQTNLAKEPGRRRFEIHFRSRKRLSLRRVSSSTRSTGSRKGDSMPSSRQ